MKNFLAVSFILLAFGACDKMEALKNKAKAKVEEQKKAATTSPVPEPPSALPVAAGGSNSAVLARVNGKEITDAEVTERVKNSLKKLESQIFDIKKRGLDDLVEESLLGEAAKKRNLSIDDLLKEEVDKKIVDPTDAELKQYYESMKPRLGNQPYDKIKDQLARQLKSMKQGSVYNSYMDSLRADAKVEILMERPRVEVSVDDDPSQGPKDAPIVLIEFSEFQCPFCKKTRPTIRQILDTYKDKVHYVFRDFPLSFHKNAPKAAQAANCAGDQGKYWEMNDKLFENQQALDIENLKKYAGELKLNTSKFNECLDSDKFAAEIAKDEQDGESVGVSGTPAYFINGIFLSGARPFEAFKEVIDDELARGK
ncbi:MAG TPA: hypothetical protein DDW49_03615 [Deltaproteobacteria bacterium]|nr:MAG: hypothetical protein A2048_09080 [Deltaproteobacteria bacterium GWA2_45_12]HBF12468.1 hypothetical protein [Deltaproteobacteria bacterium]